MYCKNVILAMISGMLIVGLVQYSCKSDTPTANTTAKTAADMAAGQEQPVAETAPVKTSAEMAEELRGFIKAHEDYRQQFIALRKQYDAIPAEVKKNAANCAELESRLEGFIEKAATRNDEINQVIAVLDEQTQLQKKPTVTATTDAASVNNQYEGLVIEQKSAVAQIEENLKAINKALEQLKASIPTKGKGVVLFQ